MKSRSAKNKGAKLQNIVAEKFGEAFNLSVGRDEDIQGREMGQQGTDIRLSKAAKEKIPFDIECKNTEKLNIWKAIEQAETNTGENRIPLVIFKRNRTKIYAVLELEHFLNIVKKP